MISARRVGHIHRAGLVEKFCNCSASSARPHPRPAAHRSSASPDSASVPHGLRQAVSSRPHKDPPHQDRRHPAQHRPGCEPISGASCRFSAAAPYFETRNIQYAKNYTVYGEPADRTRCPRSPTYGPRKPCACSDHPAIDMLTAWHRFVRLWTFHSRTLERAQPECPARSSSIRLATAMGSAIGSIATETWPSRYGMTSWKKLP